MLRQFEIWAEGFRATGESGTATFYGTVVAKTFEEACAQKFRKNDLYDPNSKTLWGCRLFDNETDARKTFG